MYNEDLIRVCKIDNGFVVEVRVEKPKKEEPKKDDGCCHMYEDKYEWKSYAVKTVDEAGQMVGKMLPIAAGKTVEDEFGDAFDEASEMNETMDEEMDK